MKPAYLSVSQITTFLACPMRYRLKYVDHVRPAFKPAALALGSAVHSAIEWLHKAWGSGVRPSEEDVVGIFEADLQAQAIDEIRFRAGEGLAELRAAGSALVALYHREVTPGPSKASELPFEVELWDATTGEVLDVPLRGWIDRIEADGTLVELKTASRKFDAEPLALNLQLSACSYAGRVLYRERPPLRLDCLLKTKEPKLERVEVTRTDEDDRRLFRIVQEVLAAIEAESFFPNPSWMCRDCEVRHRCPLWA